MLLEMLCIRSFPALSFEREKDNQTVIFVANLTKDTTTFSMDVKGNFTDYMNGKSRNLTSSEITLQPWEYWILIK